MLYLLLDNTSLSRKHTRLKDEKNSHIGALKKVNFITVLLFVNVYRCIVPRDTKGNTRYFVFLLLALVNHDDQQRGAKSCTSIPKRFKFRPYMAQVTCVRGGLK